MRSEAVLLALFRPLDDEAAKKPESLAMKVRVRPRHIGYREDQPIPILTGATRKTTEGIQMKRLVMIVASIGFAGLAAACSPSAGGQGQGLLAGLGIANASSGFTGTAHFTCGPTAYPVDGNGTSVTIELFAGETVTLVGGPLTYAGSSNSITFAGGYGSFVWSAGGSTLNCTRV